MKVNTCGSLEFGRETAPNPSCRGYSSSVARIGYVVMNLADHFLLWIENLTISVTSPTQ
jgi:hypothetical protein